MFQSPGEFLRVENPMTHLGHHTNGVYISVKRNSSPLKYGFKKFQTQWEVFVAAYAFTQSKTPTPFLQHRSMEKVMILTIQYFDNQLRLLLKAKLLVGTSKASTNAVH